MNTEILMMLLGWSALVNYGILLVWLLMLVLARDWVRVLHSKIMGLDMSSEEFGRMHYLLMAQFKIMVIIFNLVPFLVLLATT